LIFAQKSLFDGILLAAGEGKRFGSETPKQFIKLKDNYTILEKSFEAIAPFAKTVIVVLPQSKPRDANLQLSLEKLANKYNCKILFCEGGNTRQQSVEKALQFVQEKYLFIHDGARPLTSFEDIEKLLLATLEHKAAILAVPVSDTIKQANTHTEITTTIDRTNLWAAQTPQAFETNLFIKAMNNAVETNFVGTDDASLLEAINEKVKLVKCEKANFKITYEADLKLLDLF
jgi:2-C-methyl-D-erythritol 4-phosphate cytidylyltransferase